MKRPLTSVSPACRSLLESSAGTRAGWVTILLCVLPDDIEGIRRSWGQFRHRLLRRPCKVLDGTPDLRCPHIQQEGVPPFALWWGGEEGEEEEQQGEAHLATVSPGVLQATSGATTCLFPTTKEPSLATARRRYHGDGPRVGRPDQWVCGEGECRSSF